MKGLDRGGHTTIGNRSQIGQPALGPQTVDQPPFGAVNPDDHHRMPNRIRLLFGGARGGSDNQEERSGSNKPMGEHGKGV